MSTPEHFQRIDGRVDLQRLGECTLAVVGVGAVGSQIAEQAARSGVGNLLLVDGDTLEAPNVARHVLGADAIGENKAAAVAARLAAAIPSLHVAYVPRYITDDVPDEDMRELLASADLVVVATDDRNVQRRIGRVALEADLPAVFPGVDADGARGEVFVALGPHTPCFDCWDLFRTADTPLRAVTALNIDTYATVDVAVRVVLGVLDPRSQFADLMRGTADDPRPRTIFFVAGPGREAGIFSTGRSIRRGVPDFRPNCPVCSRFRPVPARAGRPDPPFPTRQPITTGSARWWLLAPLALFILGLAVPSGLVWALAAIAGTGAIAMAVRGQ